MHSSALGCEEIFKLTKSFYGFIISSPVDLILVLRLCFVCRGGGDGRMVSPVRGRGQQSLELRGNSEYIPISDNADVIGGDQLEKLLLKSKQVRY